MVSPVSTPPTLPLGSILNASVIALESIFTPDLTFLIEKFSSEINIKERKIFYLQRVNDKIKCKK